MHRSRLRCKETLRKPAVSFSTVGAPMNICCARNSGTNDTHDFPKSGCVHDSARDDLVASNNAKRRQSAQRGSALRSLSYAGVLAAKYHVSRVLPYLDGCLLNTDSTCNLSGLRKRQPFYVPPP
jgi:hypothetical protein